MQLQKHCKFFFFHYVPLLFRTLTRIALVSGWISQQGLAFWTCSTPYLQKPLRVSTRSLLGIRGTTKHHTPLKLKNMVRTRNELLYAIQYWSATYLVVFFPHVSFSSAKIWSEHQFSNCNNHPGQRGHSESLCKVRICSNNVKFFTEKIRHIPFVSVICSTWLKKLFFHCL